MATVKVEIWRMGSGACFLVEDLDLAEASVFTALGAYVAETKEVETKEEGVRWFTEWVRGLRPDVRVEPVGAKKLRDELLGALALPKGDKPS